MLEFCAEPCRPRTVIPSAWADLAFDDSRSHRNTKSQRMILLRNNRTFLRQGERQLLWNDALCGNDARVKPFIARANTINPRNSRRICVFTEYRSPKQTSSKPFRMISLQIGKNKCRGMIFLQKKWGEGVPWRTFRAKPFSAANVSPRKGYQQDALFAARKSSGASRRSHFARKSWTSGAFARQRV